MLMKTKAMLVGRKPITIEDVSLVAQRGVKVKLEASRRFVGKIEASVRLLKEALKDERIVYGVNTGVGDSCGRLVPNDLVEDLPARLSRFHGCGLGRHFDSETTIAILLARLVSLARGYSGVRMKVLERLCEMINCKILPLVPEEGSVGASGDLTPLSYIAGVISGEGEVRLRGEKPVAAALALKKHGLAPIALAPKESLAIMNGTSVMTALACLAYGRAEYLARLSSRLTAMVSLALLGNKAHFAPRLFELKPHPGQARLQNGSQGILVILLNAPIQSSSVFRIPTQYAAPRMLLACWQMPCHGCAHR
jgi:histidine ammonia-lyase